MLAETSLSSQKIMTAENAEIERRHVFNILNFLFKIS